MQCILSLSADPAPRVAQSALTVLKTTQITGSRGGRQSMASNGRAGFEKAISRGFSSIAKSLSRSKELSSEGKHGGASTHGGKQLHYTSSSGAVMQNGVSPPSSRDAGDSRKASSFQELSGCDLSLGRESLLFEQLAEEFAQPMHDDDRQKEEEAEGGPGDAEFEAHAPSRRGSRATPRGASPRSNPRRGLQRSESANEREERSDRLREECRRSQGLVRTHTS